MYEIIKKYNHRHPNNDMEVVEAIEIGDARYKDGVMYTFRYLRYVEALGTYETLFAIENCHGQPHVHKGEEKYDVDYDWRQAYAEFKRMSKEYRGRKQL